MKNLELMGVQEMDAVEMKNVDGGIAPIIGAFIIVRVISALTIKKAY
jgi:lactobin A/cerein 7B family class IIb bacteriocin